jgi:predicted NBD/HSP70 family sugar kinase
MFENRSKSSENRSKVYEVHMTSPRVAPDSPGAVLQLIRSGTELIDHGYVREGGGDRSRSSGRRPRHLTLRPDYGEVVAVDLGSHHATVARFDMSGKMLSHQQKAVSIAEGPDPVLWWIHSLLQREPGPPGLLRGVTIGVPGPVDARTGRVVSPSRMPGWHQVSIATEMARHGPPAAVLVDNDANLMALGAHVADPVDHMVFVKAGTGIGCGVIASGRLHRGSAGAAGDISHLPVPGREDVACSCGRNGCLDAVASGAALVRDLQAAGVAVETPADVVTLAGDAEPTVTRMLREAGRATGELLATVVNFFDPDALVIGGQLSRAEPFVASLRAAVFERCLPMATENLQVRITQEGHLVGVRGGARLMIEYLLDPERVNMAIERG